jgi:hypothetical protein
MEAGGTRPYYRCRVQLRKKKRKVCFQDPTFEGKTLILHALPNQAHNATRNPTKFYQLTDDEEESKDSDHDVEGGVRQNKAQKKDKKKREWRSTGRRVKDKDWHYCKTPCEHVTEGQTGFKSRPLLGDHADAEFLRKQLAARQVIVGRNKQVSELKVILVSYLQLTLLGMEAAVDMLFARYVNVQSLAAAKCVFATSGPEQSNYLRASHEAISNPAAVEPPRLKSCCQDCIAKQKTCPQKKPCYHGIQPMILILAYAFAAHWCSSSWRRKYEQLKKSRNAESGNPEYTTRQSEDNRSKNEERLRDTEERDLEKDEDGNPGAGAGAADATSPPTATNVREVYDAMEEDEDAADAASPSTATKVREVDDAMEKDEDKLVAALRMSMGASVDLTPSQPSTSAEPAPAPRAGAYAASPPTATNVAADAASHSTATDNSAQGPESTTAAAAAASIEAAAASTAAATSAAQAAEAAAQVAEAAAQAAAAASGEGDDAMEEDEDELEAALRMSMGASVDLTPSQPSTSADPAPAPRAGAGAADDASPSTATKVDRGEFFRLAAQEVLANESIEQLKARFLSVGRSWKKFSRQEPESFRINLLCGLLNLEGHGLLEAEVEEMIKQKADEPLANDPLPQLSDTDPDDLPHSDILELGRNAAKKVLENVSDDDLWNRCAKSPRGDRPSRCDMLMMLLDIDKDGKIWTENFSEHEVSQFQDLMTRSKFARQRRRQQQNVMMHAKDCHADRYCKPQCHQVSSQVCRRLVGLYVAPSSIPGAGLGLFLTEDIVEGQDLTFYGNLIAF